MHSVSGPTITEQSGSPLDSAWTAKLSRGSSRPGDERIGLPSASLKSYSMSVMSPIVEIHAYLIIKLLDDFALGLPIVAR